MRGGVSKVAGSLRQESRRVWTVLRLALRTFFRIDGELLAGAFAFYAFFALFPLIILFVTIASAFIDRDRAGQEVIAYLEAYVPIHGEMQRHIIRTITGVINARGQAGAVALLMLVWAALQFVTALVSATNRAWDTKAYNWWRLPLKSLLLLVIMVSAVLLGIPLPMLGRLVSDWLLPASELRSWVYVLTGLVAPSLTAFLGLTLFYKLAPRKPTRVADVWGAALCATALLRAAEGLFGIYLKSFATLNAVYGAFGGVIALLLWIYLSGCVIIFGACLCAARSADHLARAS